MPDQRERGDGREGRERRREGGKKEAGEKRDK